MKKKIIIIVLVVLVLLGVGGYFIFARGKKQLKSTVPTLIQEEDAFPTIADSEFSASIKPASAANTIVFKIEKFPKGTKTIEYEISWDTEKNGNILEQGVSNSSAPLKIKSDDQIIPPKEFYLGTCSKNVCSPDKVVSKIRLIIRIEINKGIKIWSKEFSII